ncbi:ArnT family glycosyltransferase [Rhodovulum euryhalinum]|uniref:ArnT family glycosyltransferase n=1 Tax=Rhodovulum euryhalinum TaxID=35805 RepID=UPI0014047906|nr:glycosyltransferase family 39 protein [Rhodovulum euryhalinum]
MLPLATTDLFVDEAQYWQWGQELDWGYYSKPPLIGWVLRAVTDLAGSDGPFWVRLPGAIFHAAAAVLIIGVARRYADPVSAAFCGIAYLTMPAIGVGSLLISTDTILLPFWAASVWLYLRLTDGRSALAAALLGLCLGLGFLGKYAAIYFPLCAALGALFIPASRIAARDAAIAAAVFAAVAAPNIVWNLQNDLITVAHTADNVGWIKKPGLALNDSGMLHFFGSQFMVMGPLLFASFLLAGVWTVARGDWQARWLVWMSAPILAIVTTQALLSKAYANWAVTAYVAAILLTVPWLWRRSRRLLWAALGVNLVLALALPVAVTQATRWRVGGDLVFERYTGRAELSEHVLSAAAAAGLTDIVAVERQVLADLFYTARDRDVTIFSLPPAGRPKNFYAQQHPYPTGRSTPSLFVRMDGGVLPCADAAEELGRWTPGPGAYDGRMVRVYRLPPSCLAAGGGA